MGTGAAGRLGPSAIMDAEAAHVSAKQITSQMLSAKEN